MSFHDYDLHNKIQPIKAESILKFGYDRQKHVHSSVLAVKYSDVEAVGMLHNNPLTMTK